MSGGNDAAPNQPVPKEFLQPCFWVPWYLPNFPPSLWAIRLSQYIYSVFFHQSLSLFLITQNTNSYVFAMSFIVKNNCEKSKCLKIGKSEKAVCSMSIQGDDTVINILNTRVSWHMKVIIHHYKK